MTALTTPFGFASTAADVVAGIDLTGRRADVTLAVRDLAAGERVAKDITATTGNERVHVGRLDLTDLDSVAAFVAAWEGPLHILVNNAGVMACPEQYTDQGREWQFPTNHLGHFALATGPHRALAADGNTRVVVVSSTGHQQSPVVEAARRWADDNITANTLMPGAIYTNLQRHTGGRGSGKVPAEFIKTVEQGAATSALLAASPLLEGIGGRYFVDCNETDVVYRHSGTLRGVARYAVDPDNARRLWTLSEGLLAKGA